VVSTGRLTSRAFVGAIVTPGRAAEIAERQMWLSALTALVRGFAEPLE
jgi:hypothetical protein